MIIGIVNIVKGGDTTPSSSGNGDLIAGGVLLIALAALGTAVYHALEDALTGVAATTGEANRTVAWLIGGAVALVIVVVTAWCLAERWRDRRAGLTSSPADVAAFYRHCTEVDTAQRARLEAAEHTARLEAEDAATAALEGGRQRRQRATATRLDRAAEVPVIDLDARGWTA